LFGKPECRRPVVRSWHRWKNNIEIDIPEILSEVLTVINMAEEWHGVGCFEHGDEFSGSMKCRDILDWLRTYQVLKKISAAWILGEIHC